MEEPDKTAKERIENVPFKRILTVNGQVTIDMFDQPGPLDHQKSLVFFKAGQDALREELGISSDKLKLKNLELITLKSEDTFNKDLYFGDDLRIVTSAYIEGDNLNFSSKIFREDDIVLENLTTTALTSDGKTAVSLPDWIKDIF